jgi:hypothetical protein
MYVGHDIFEYSTVLEKIGETTSLKKFGPFENGHAVFMRRVHCFTTLHWLSRDDTAEEEQRVSRKWTEPISLHQGVGRQLAMRRPVQQIHSDIGVGDND